MSILRPFIEARALLGVEASDDAVAIKRAYRKLVILHPPDTDAEGFRRVREAYELLSDPSTRIREMLLSPQPTVTPPELPEAPELSAKTPLPIALLRLAAATVDVGALLAAPGATETTDPNAASERNSTQ
jgi:hypothetical protein